MATSKTIVNTLVMNKYAWMGRQLRHFNDVGSIISWANAMILVKGLLLESESPPSAPSKTHPPPLAPHSPPQHHLATNSPLITHFNWSSTPPTHPESSITPPTTICFQPSKKKVISKSPFYSSNISPTKPKPLTTYTHRQPTISPTNSLAPTPKRRKIIIPPAVDYHASTTRSEVSRAPGVNIDRIRKAVSNALEWHRVRRRLHYEHDLRVLIWTQRRAEAELKLPEHFLDPYKHVVHETVCKYFEIHGKKPIEWIASDP